MKAISKICSDRSYREVLLEKTFHGAPPEVRHQLHKFTMAPVDWRWEHLEEVLHDETALYPELQPRFGSKHFSSSDGLLCSTVQRGLVDELHPYLAQWALCFSAAVGREASWMEGCFCHGDIFAGASSTYKRRRLMVEKTGCAKCPWKGKRLCNFALGHCKVMCRNVSTHTSPGYIRQMLRAPAHIAARITVIDGTAKTS